MKFRSRLLAVKRKFAARASSKVVPSIAVIHGNGTAEPRFAAVHGVLFDRRAAETVQDFRRRMLEVPGPYPRVTHYYVHEPTFEIARNR